MTEQKNIPCIIARNSQQKLNWFNESSQSSISENVCTSAYVCNRGNIQTMHYSTVRFIEYHKCLRMVSTVKKLDYLGDFQVRSYTNGRRNKC